MESGAPPSIQKPWKHIQDCSDPAADVGAVVLGFLAGKPGVRRRVVPLWQVLYGRLSADAGRGGLDAGTGQPSIL